MSNILERFVKAAKKQRSALKEGGWGHAIWCNFGTENKFCNCGIADLQRALEDYEEITPNPTEKQ